MAAGPRLAAVRSLAHQLSNGSVTVNESITEGAGVRPLSGVSVLVFDVVSVVVSGNACSNLSRPGAGFDKPTAGFDRSAADCGRWTADCGRWAAGGGDLRAPPKRGIVQGTTRTKAGFHTLDTVLHTKFLIPPPRPQRVQRMRLLAGLRADPPPPVTLVAAPAGYGKTTLVADWITTDHRRAAWLTLDSSENEEGAFWTAVATALDSVQPGVSARALALLRQPQPPPLPTILTALLNDLTTHLTPDAAGQPVLLVLDDYHMITQRPIHETVTALIERLPPALRLVLTSRADPPLRLARLRVRAQLLEVRAADLAFAAPEVDTFLTETMGLTLPAAVAPALLARTEGWVAALQLA